MSTVTHFIDGKRWSGGTGRRQSIFNPATGEAIGSVELGTAADVDLAVRTAAQAAEGWRATPAAKRSQVLFNFRDRLKAHADELAEAISREHGKTLADAKGEIARGLEVVEFACGAPHLLKGEYSENTAGGIDTFSVRQPLGVVAGITPFNFPAMVPLWMYPVSIACGNGFVHKPSERDPSVSVRLAELFTEAGLPPGVLNVVQGESKAVEALLDHPLLDGISFVGSTKIGQLVYARGAASGKRVQALCGAKNHLVVMPDADMAQVADALIGSAYGSAGERCMAVSVAVPIGEETAERLIETLTPRVRALKVGPFTDADADFGPVISQESLARIHGYIEDGIAAGARLVVDGRTARLQGFENGFFIGGCLFDRVTPEMSIYQDEIFGPVLAVVRAGGYDEAVRLVNEHAYGNGAAIFTRDGDAAWDFWSRVKIGMVGVNVPIPVPVAYHSFGGWKRSLFGDHHIYGMEGVRFNTRLKTMTARWPRGARDGAVFNFHAGSEAGGS